MHAASNEKNPNSNDILRTNRQWTNKHNKSMESCVVQYVMYRLHCPKHTRFMLMYEER